MLFLIPFLGTQCQYSSSPMTPNLIYMNDWFNTYGTYDETNQFQLSTTVQMSGISYNNYKDIAFDPLTRVHNTTVIWDLQEKWKWFDTIVGCQDYAQCIVKITVQLDNTTVFSQKMNGTGYPISLNITGIQKMTWIMNPLGFSNAWGAGSSDNIYWVNSVLITPNCFGIYADSNQSLVCNGQGTCTGPDRCNCRNGYQGYNCQFASTLPVGYTYFSSIFGTMTNVDVSSNVQSNYGTSPWIAGNQYQETVLISLLNYINTTMTVKLSGLYKSFTTLVGVQDGCANSALFQITIFLDNIVAWQSPPMYQGTLPIDLNVTGVQVMQWVMDPLGENNCDQVYLLTPIFGGIMCFGIPAGSPNVCSGAGACISGDACQCNTNYFGKLPSYFFSLPYLRKQLPI